MAGTLRDIAATLALIAILASCLWIRMKYHRWQLKGALREYELERLEK